jgi:hypothetical protein
MWFISVGIPVDLNFKHGRLELVITHIGRLSLSLSLSLSFQRKNLQLWVMYMDSRFSKNQKLGGYNKIKESSNTGNLHLH